MNDEKTGVRLNEVLDRRSAEGNTEMKANLNSAPLDRNCHRCGGNGIQYVSNTDNTLFGDQYMECDWCGGTGREATKVAERRSNVK